MTAIHEQIVRLNDAIQARIDNPDYDIDIKSLADDLVAYVFELQAEQREALKEQLLGTLALLKAMENRLLQEKTKIHNSLQELSAQQALEKAYTQNQEEET
ncbi:MAG: hypothetical protein J0G29_02825 [Alphaproteobacteria bacterium]|nr:hypothetical protein [Alphaproteobacteria bacterium]OJV46337.1 MAG: hypothetical protein BGO28_03160 [Alphaproteobacteria bacterium 43-37]